MDEDDGAEAGDHGARDTEPGDPVGDAEAATPDGEDPTLVAWRPWGEAAFEEAREHNRPVLLSLTAPWCTWCRRMDRETYGEPRIAAHVREDFVPVRVDVDRHPRVRERYNMGGFPSTVFCTPAGEVMTGATYLGPDGFRQILDSVRRTWEEKGEAAGSVPRALRDPDPPAGELTPAVERHMLEQVGAAFDEEFGGWGTGAKFPLPRTVEFAARRDRPRATRTLEAVRTHLYDTYDGGFYRYADERDWSSPHREKLTDENAALVRAFATGYLYTGDEPYRETAAGAVDYLTTELWVAEPPAPGDDGGGGGEAGSDGDAARGAFAASQAGGDYFALEAAEREASEPPHVDRTVYADRNGLAADALLRVAAYADEPGAARYAERALGYVCAALVDEDGRVAHAAGGATAGETDTVETETGGPGGADADETGLLVDHARVLGGLTTAAQALGPEAGPDGGYLAVARRVADRTLADLRAPEGAFLDGPRAGPGLCARPLRPLDLNAECADALVDLAALTGEGRYRDAARGALAAFADAHDRMGVEVAGYATACARARSGPLVVETPPAGSDLHRAAWRLADHEKVVAPGDRETARVRGGDEEAAEPAALSALVADHADATSAERDFTAGDEAGE